MSFEAEINYLIGLCEADLAKGKEIRYTCPYCGISLAGLFKETKQKKIDDDEIDFEDEEIYCPCCKQSGAF